MKEWRKLGYLEKNPDDEQNSDDEFQKMPHTKAQNFKPRPRLKPAL